MVSKKSKDRSKEIAERKGTVVLIDNGKGKGEGIRCAVKRIKRDIVVFIDADSSHDPKDIPRIIKPIEDGKAEMVIGSRFLGGSGELHGDFNKFLRMFFSMCIAQTINWRFNKNLMDTQNGYRAMKTAVLKRLRLESVHTEIETELCIKCLKRGYRILEVPSYEGKRIHGMSSLSLWRHGPRYLYVIIKNIF